MNATDQCTEDDAERVREKAELNFCDWFVASEGAFDAAARREHDAASAAFDALFGETDAVELETDGPHLAAADALFGKEPKE